MIQYGKPALTTDQQVDLLIWRGIRIADRTQAQQHLTHISYYRLRAYWLPFEQPASNGGDHAFAAGADFATVLAIYDFDRELRLLLLDETTSGLDPQARHLMWERLQQLLKQGKSIMLTTHFAKQQQHEHHTGFSGRVWAAPSQAKRGIGAEIPVLGSTMGALGVGGEIGHGCRCLLTGKWVAFPTTRAA